MQDVSVLPLWRCLERRGGPDLFITEYFRVHPDSHPNKVILRSIRGMSDSKPVIAQMIGNDPEHLLRTALIIQEETACAGIDVNLGCPAPKVCGKLGGGALLRDRDLILQIVETLRPAIKGTLTLKTRIGFDSPEEFNSLLELFASLPIDGLAVHGRTVVEKYQSPVHPDCIERAVEQMPFPVTANGNIVSVETALAMAEKTGASGLMIGRGAIRNPWLFERVRNAFGNIDTPPPTLRDLRGYLVELSTEIEKEGDFETELQLVHRLKKFSNYIASGIAEGELNYQLRRAKTLSQFHASADHFLNSDSPFPEEPSDDGKLFCGFSALTSGDRDEDV